jgi:two-component system chemotaxis sensor kinase CheA
MNNPELVFESEFIQRLTALQENTIASVPLELHRIRTAARAANQSVLEKDVALLELALQENPQGAQGLKIYTNHPKSLQLLEVLGAQAVSPEVPAKYLETFKLELANRSANLQQLISNLRANTSDTILRNQAKLELHRLQIAVNAVQHPLEPTLQSLTQILEQPELPGFDAWSETRVSDEDSQVFLEIFQKPPNPGKVVQRPVSTDSVRVNVQRLDTLLAQSGELTVARIRLETRVQDVTNMLNRLQTGRKNWRWARSLRNKLASPEQPAEMQQFLSLFDKSEDRFFQMYRFLEQLIEDLTQDTAQLRTVNTIIEDEVLSVRLLPAANLFPNLERLVRDLGQSLGKRARFETLGGEIGLDRKILDGLRDPLMHMVRNSLDHGLETPETRKTAGKPEQGSIKLAVQQSGSLIEITLSDDGAGINTQKVRQVAQTRGLIQENTDLDDAQTLELLFAPGFSTATSISETSGRGVGMDVVRENIRALNGSISLQTQAGRGSSFHLRLPATLATSRVLIVRVADSSLAIPTSVIERVSRVRASELVNQEGQQVVVLEGRAIPVIELSAVLEMPVSDIGHWRTFVSLQSQTKPLCLIVDSLVGEQEIVVKKLSYPLEHIAHLEGGAVLGSGALVPILNTQIIIEKAYARLGSSINNQKISKPKTRILVVDDSITTRSLERSILENAGFETRVAINGIEALEILNTEEIQLVLSDVEMPLMDGFTLTQEIRGIERLKHLPIILVTSLNTNQHKERGAKAGADAYIVKSEFDQNKLLETVARLL